MTAEDGSVAAGRPPTRGGARNQSCAGNGDAAPCKTTWQSGHDELPLPSDELHDSSSWAACEGAASGERCERHAAVACVGVCAWKWVCATKFCQVHAIRQSRLSAKRSLDLLSSTYEPDLDTLASLPDREVFYSRSHNSRPVRECTR
jgi:hypothetical protein